MTLVAGAWVFRLLVSPVHSGTRATGVMDHSNESRCIGTVSTFSTRRTVRNRGSYRTLRNTLRCYTGKDFTGDADSQPCPEW